MRFSSSHCDSSDAPSWISGTHVQLPTRRVAWGAGSAATVREELAAAGARRTLVLTTRSLRERVASLAEDAVGPTFGGVHAELTAHAPHEAVRAAASRATREGVDAIVSIGGGSVIDAGKAVVSALAGSGPRPVVHAALPTTLSGAEFAHHYGITGPADGPGASVATVKRSHADVAATPQLVVLDSCLTRDTPDWLWCGSAMKAIDHAVEGLLAPGERPLASPLALVGISTLAATLGRARDLEALDARTSCQVAAWQCYAAPADFALGLSHRIGHALGGTYGVPHALTSPITMPLVVGASPPEHDETLERVADALGAPRDRDDTTRAAGRAAAALSDLVAALGLPQRLRDVGIGRDRLPALAEQVQATSGDLLDQPGMPSIGALLERAY